MQAVLLAIGEFIVGVALWAAESVIGAIVLAVAAVMSLLTALAGAACIVASLVCMVGWWGTWSPGWLVAGMLLHLLGWCLLWLGLLPFFATAGAFKDVQEGFFNFIPSLFQVISQAVRGATITGLQQPDVGFDKAAMAVRFLTQYAFGISALGVGALFIPALAYGPKLGIAYHILAVALVALLTGINVYCNVRLRQIAAQEPEPLPAGATLTPVQAAARDAEADNLKRQQRLRVACFRWISMVVGGLLALALFARPGEAPAETIDRNRIYWVDWVQVWFQKNLTGLALDPIWWIVILAAGLYIVGSWLSGDRSVVTDSSGRTLRGTRTSRQSLGGALRSVAVLVALGAGIYALSTFVGSTVTPIVSAYGSTGGRSTGTGVSPGGSASVTTGPGMTPDFVIINETTAKISVTLKWTEGWVSRATTETLDPCGGEATVHNPAAGEVRLTDIKVIGGGEYFSPANYNLVTGRLDYLGDSRDMTPTYAPGQKIVTRWTVHLTSTNIGCSSASTHSTSRSYKRPHR